MSKVIPFPKKKRISNPKLLNIIRNMQCLLCPTWPSDPHHVTSKGAGGHDTGDNVVNLCRAHHNEIHQIGVKTFATKHKRFMRWLREHDRDDVLVDPLEE